MKYLLLAILLLTGCSKKEIKLDNIKNIKFNDINLIESDYKKINIEGIYTKSDKIPKTNVLLEITNDKDINKFYVTNKNIYTKINNTIYKKDSNILEELLKLSNNYTDDNIIDITYNSSFTYDENKLNIKLDNTNSNYELTLSDQVYDFKIHKIDNNEIVDLLYLADLIDNKNITIRTNQNIQITFVTKYNLMVTISKNNNNFEISTKNRK